MPSLIYSDICFSVTTCLHSSKTLENNKLLPILKAESIRNTNKEIYWELYTLVFYYCENLCWFFPCRIFQFSDILYHHIRSISNSFLILLLTFFQILLYFSKNSLSFNRKGIYLVSLKSLLYRLIFGRNMHKGLFV